MGMLYGYYDSGYGSPYGAYGGGPTMGRNPMSTLGAAPGTPTGTRQVQCSSSRKTDMAAIRGRGRHAWCRNPDNTLLTQGTPQEYEQIVKPLAGSSLTWLPGKFWIEARMFTKSL